MNKKDFDKLFQEKFKDFHETPDERVWESIEDSLNRRRKKRRVIPLWWKLGGVAAILAIALIAINPFENPVDADDAVTDIEKPEIPEQKNEAKDPLPADIDNVIDDSESLAGDVDEEEESSEDIYDSSESETSNNSLVKTSEPSRSDKTKDQSNELIIEERAIAGAEESENIKEAIAQSDNKKEVVAQTDAQEDEKSLADVLQSSQIYQDELNNKVNEENRALGEYVNKELPDQNAETAIADQTETEDKEDSTGKKSIFDEIEKQQEEEALAEQSKESKWSVGPSVAPVYFDSFGEGSPIHSSFVSNSKSGNVNLSYGLGVSYDISKKLKIRSGIHKVDYGYDTNDITFSSSLVASTSAQITNIDYTSTSRNLVVENSSQRQASQEFEANDIIAQSPSRNGRMVQEFGYVEVPMELNYSLLDKKFNIDIIGGFSSLFLVNNSVTLESGGTATEMGEANNLNDINFSTNVGLGINYELTDKMKVHLEPMFKYQMNTFSDTEGNFQPYSLGVYTGMSFKF